MERKLVDVRHRVEQEPRLLSDITHVAPDSGEVRRIVARMLEAAKLSTLPSRRRRVGWPRVQGNVRGHRRYRGGRCQVQRQEHQVQRREHQGVFHG